MTNPATQKETPAGGCNHCAGVNTQNKRILPILAMFERIALALEYQCRLMAEQNDHLQHIQRVIDQASDR
ncbi:MAG: hypothetical protein Q8O85_16545 [Rhodoferax sp.]|nr:hypothetical protein [Rhodoferax sp.]